MENLDQNQKNSEHFDVSEQIKWLEETEAALKDFTSSTRERRMELRQEYDRRMEQNEYRLAKYLREHPGRYDLEDIQILDEILLKKQAEAQKAKLEREQEEFESKIPKNLLTNFDDTIRAMALLENDQGWRIQQTNEEGNTAMHALKAVREHNARTTRYANDVFCIYGSGGINRYWVASDGAVRFNLRNAKSPKHAERARRLGFSIN